MFQAKIVPQDFAALFASENPNFGSLPEWCVLGGHCSRCEREGWIDRWELQGRYGKETRIADLRPALRCLKCGNKGTNTWTVGKLPR
ncbi:hypothetical protein [Shinella pollutisoli]|uniref:Uncharacterized protein n=1 Tax=Shinella pollutisoli TaxID=2250594 RepID=A0ABV7DJ43_9HYPH|nr:hypothetical protein [Shinella pollutisoli]